MEHQSKLRSRIKATKAHWKVFAQKEWTRTKVNYLKKKSFSLCVFIGIENYKLYFSRDLLIFQFLLTWDEFRPCNVLSCF